MKSTFFMFFCGLLFLFGGWGCNGKNEEDVSRPLFEPISLDQSRIDFQNTITETAIANIMTFQYFYNGGGIAVGDINNNGLMDLYFTGNMVSNRLYLNKGDLKFQDISLATGTSGREDGWATGAVMVDINQDGLQDIYVCYSGDYPAEQRKNQLFVNQGLDEDGIPYFKEMASVYGIDDDGYSTSAVFFDYDLDGDLDLLILQHNPRLFSNLDENQFKKWLSESAPDMHSKLYRNDGGFFHDATKEAGLHVNPLSYGLGAGVSDINQDGFPDIYLGNDYSAPDFLYINNGDGTFSDQAGTSMGHTSLYTMGVEIADFNNNGLVDIFTLDMLPEDNRRQKLLFSPENYDHFDLIAKVGLHYQYMRNMLHLNNGDGTFSEIGQLAGVSNTDWSWAPLFADFNNNGHKDLFISNGFLKDFTNLDFVNYRNEYLQNQKVSQEGIVDLINKMPATPLQNYIFENKGKSVFLNRSKDWGLTELTNSNGAVYVDLDNDGDLDLVINNINGPASVYKNQSKEISDHSYLQVELIGKEGNLSGFGAKLFLYSAQGIQFLEQQPYRGFQGNVSPVLHFGLGSDAKIDSLIIIWPDGQNQKLIKPEVNSRIKVKKESGPNNLMTKEKIKSNWQKVSQFDLELPDRFFRDFNRQGQLMETLSSNGPIIRSADLTGNGKEEVVVSSGYGKAAKIFHQLEDGTYSQNTLDAPKETWVGTVTDFLFFDANNDGLLDIYLVKGGYHDLSVGDEALNDILLLQDENGGFLSAGKDFFSASSHSGSVIQSIDINGDGYMDLFIGGSYLPGRFPESDHSFFLINKRGSGFEAYKPEMIQDVKRVSAAQTADLNGDGNMELIIASEWSALKIFCFEEGEFKNCTDHYLAEPEFGIWKSLLVDDFDGDGIPEILAGNYGLNSPYKASIAEPMNLHFADFDQNGSIDPILSFYIQGQPYPYLSRDELGKQLYRKKALFTNYEAYADAKLGDIFTKEELKAAKILEVNTLETTLYVQQNGRYVKTPFPIQAQYAPVYSMLSVPSHEGVKDILLAGNQLEARLKVGRIDANYGVYLRTEGGLTGYKYLTQPESGFQFRGDVRSLHLVNGQLWVGKGNGTIEVYWR